MFISKGTQQIANNLSTEDEDDANPALKQGGRETSSKINVESSYRSGKGKIIRQHKFYIHSAWLAVQSSYFRSLFFSAMKKSSVNEVHLQISTNTEQAHLMLLEAMYKTDILDSVSVDELLDVLILAQKYDVKLVFKRCKHFLKAAVDSLEICKKIIYFITIDNPIPDVDDLVGALQSFLAKKFSPLDKTWKTKSFKELCEPSLKYLMSSDELVTASENTVFHALMHWIEERDVENDAESPDLSSLLSVVRFELIPFDYLYNIVQHHPVAKNLMGFTEHYLKGITYHASSRTMKQRLACEPVKRRSETHSFVAFTWVLPANKLDSDTLGITDGTLESEEFWYCGYKMRLVITGYVDVRKLEGISISLAKLSLEIRNLTQQSEVSIWWQPKSPYFKFTPIEKTDAFDKKACLSSVAIMKAKVNICSNQSKSQSTFIGPISAPTTQPSVNSGTASSTQSTRLQRVPVSTTQPGFTFPTATSTPSTGFGGVPVSTTKPSFKLGTFSAAPSTGFGGVPVSTSQPTLKLGTSSPTPSTGFRGVPVSTTQPSFKPGTPSPTPSTGFGEVPVSTTKPSFKLGTPSAAPSTGFGGVPVSTTKPSFKLGTFSAAPSTGFGGVPVSTSQPRLKLGTSSPTPSTGFRGVPVSTTQPSLKLGTPSTAPSTGFDGVPMSTTKPSFKLGTTSSAPSTGFGGVPVSTTKPSFKLSAPSPTPSTGFGGASVSTTQSGFKLGATVSTNTTSVTPPRFNKPLFSFTGSTNTVEPSKSDLTSKPESSHPSYVHIDVIIKLVE